MHNFATRIINSIIRRAQHIIILMRARKKSRESISNREGNNILVLCYGNIYRSPLAEYLLKIFCSSETFNIMSAGFHKKENRTCEPEYLQILEEYGYDLYEHRSKIVRPSDIKWADIILIMDRYNFDMLKKMDRDCISKTMWIGAFSKRKSVEVQDPYDKGYDFTKDVISDIEMCIRDICLELSSNQAVVDNRALKNQNI
ncbi:hypothetical protein [Candidatus Thiodiazotropha sp. LNASS1]|uniref:arsenate reductase/protein-tyrosine-phosphatase family protein n=1 Tax=Candidatus Thiodiazotropha sp. LNASS1 TaxID=3096260 RepID=UPI0034DE2851